MFIAKVVSKGKQGKSYTSILLRESSRVGSAVKSKTLAVLTHLPAHVLEAVRRAIAQPADSLCPSWPTLPTALCACARAESLGALWTVDQVAQHLGIKKALGVTREAELGYWQVLARVLRPGTSLLAMVRLATTCAAAALLGWQPRLHRRRSLCQRPLAGRPPRRHRTAPLASPARPTQGPTLSLRCDQQLFGGRLQCLGGLGL